MLKKISKQSNELSKETMRSTKAKGGWPRNPIECGFQCWADCNEDEQIYVGSGAFNGGYDESGYLF